MQEILLTVYVEHSVLPSWNKRQNDGREAPTEEGFVEGESSESAIGNTSYFNSEESISWQTSSQNVRS